MDLEDHRLLFIGGMHKSGTSIFHRCIRDHSLISGFSGTGVPEDEGQLLQSVFPPAGKTGGMGRYAFNDDSHLTERSPLASEANARILFQEWSAHWDLSKPVLVEKSPPTLIRSRFLQALFPQARFVFLLRHPIAVSYSTSRWTKQPLHELIAHWIVGHERFQNDLPELHHAPLIVRYEDFARDPETVLGRVWSLVGLDAEPLERRVRSGIDRKYLRRWKRMGWTPRGRRYVRLVRERLGSRLDALGYGYTLAPPFEV